MTSIMRYASGDHGRKCGAKALILSEQPWMADRPIPDDINDTETLKRERKRK
jgi:hypothetical protein